MISIEELTTRITSYNEQLENPHIPPHSSNLLHQLSKRDAARKLREFNDVCNSYLRLREVGNQITLDLNDYVSQIVDATNAYMDVLLTVNYNHQADFKSSVIPEMFFLILYKIVKTYQEDYFVSAQSDVPIECMFDLQGGSRMMFKTKRLDMLVYKDSQLSLDGATIPFIIPLIAMEMKTNLDKNMMSGIEHSVTALKKTFPNSLYYVVTEFSDMAIDKLNYASSGIDEIYILRQQKRAAVRRDLNLRNSINPELVLEIANHCIQLMEEVHTIIPSTEVRMTTGKLIH